MPASLFISYARRDGRDFALNLQSELEKRGYVTWLDTAEIEGGASWSNEIEIAINNCDILLALLTEGSYHSEICRAEQLRALRLNKRVIPLQLQSSADRPLHLEHLNYRDFTDPARYPDMLTTLEQDIEKGEKVPVPLRWQRTVLTNAPARPPHFLERTEVIGRLRNALTSDASDRRLGITAVQGMGGIGKTVMATALCHDELIHDAYPDGIVWITIGDDPGDLTLKIREIGKALGDSIAYYDNQEAAINRLRTYLPGKAALIVLDDVWHKSDIDPFIVDHAPGARLLFTTRDAQLVSAVDAHRFELETLSDTEARGLISNWAGVSIDLLPNEAEMVLKRCGNLPLALSLCGAQIREGTSWADIHEALEAAELEFLNHPNGSILTSIKVSVDALEKRDPAHAERYRELAVFPDDVTLPEVAILTLWGHTGSLSERLGRKLITTLAHLAMLRISEADSQRWIDLHDLQYLYLKGLQSDPSHLHEQLLIAYEAKCTNGWATGPNDGYYFQQLPRHLQAAKRQTELHTLLTGSPDWMQAKFTACQGDSAYAADLTQMIERYRDPLAHEQIVPLVQLHTARQVINHRVGLYTDKMLEALVCLGREAEALSHARLRPEAQTRFEGLFSVYQMKQQRGNLQLDDLAEEIEEQALAIQTKTRQAEALSSLATALAQHQHFTDAERVATAIQDNFKRDSVLYSLASALAQHQRFIDAERISTAIKDDNYRSYALTSLTVRIAQYDPAKAQLLFDQAERMATAIPNDNYRDYSLSLLAEALVQQQRFTEAERVVTALQDDSSRAYALRSLAQALAQHDPGKAQSLFDQAEHAATAIHDNLRRAYAFSSLITTLAQQQRFTEAERVTSTIQDDFSRATALSSLAQAFAQHDPAKAQSLFDQAEHAATAIQDDVYRTDALSSLAEALAHHQRFIDAERVVTAIQDDSSRAYALSSLTEVLAHHQRFIDAERVATAIQDDFYRTKALSSLTIALTQHDLAKAQSLFDQAKHVTTFIQDDSSRAQSLSLLAQTLAQQQRFPEAEHIAAVIQHAYFRATALNSLAQALALHDPAKAQFLFAQAERIATAIQDDFTQASVFCSLAEALAQHDSAKALFFFDQAERIATAIQDDRSRYYVLNSLAQALAQQQRFPEAERVTSTIEDDSYRAFALSFLAQALAQHDPAKAQSLFDQAEYTTSTIQNDFNRAYNLCSLAQALAQHDPAKAQSLLVQAERVAAAIQHDYARAGALCYVAAVLVQYQRFADAERIVNTIKDDRSQAIALRSLAQAHRQNGSIVEALIMLGLRDLEEYFRFLTEGYDDLKIIVPDEADQVYFAMLIGTLRIMAWVQPSWNAIADIIEGVGR